MNDFVKLRRGSAPLIISIPHAGSEIPGDIASKLVSLWLARRDADWWVDALYDMPEESGFTILQTTISRTVIDVNRDPSGRSLYPGQATTELCPLATFDGEPLYRAGNEPGPAEIAARTQAWFAPYHAMLRQEIARLQQRWRHIVLFDAHSIRSHIPRLFEGELPHLNIGTNGGKSCDGDMARAVERVCAQSDFSFVIDGRFRGGWITRRYGDPAAGIHAIQLELAMRSYMDEPALPSPENWPPPLSRERSRDLSTTLNAILAQCREHAEKLNRD